jgi:hypothetical protein
MFSLDWNKCQVYIYNLFLATITDIKYIEVPYYICYLSLLVITVKFMLLKYFSKSQQHYLHAILYYNFSRSKFEINNNRPFIFFHCMLPQVLYTIRMIKNNFVNLCKKRQNKILLLPNTGHNIHKSFPYVHNRIYSIQNNWHLWKYIN